MGGKAREGGHRGEKKRVTVKMLLPNTPSAYLSIIHTEIQRQTKLLFCSRYTAEISEAQPTCTLLSKGLSKTAHLNSNTIRAKGRFAEANFLFSLPHATKQSFLLLATNRQYWTKDDIPFLRVKQGIQLKIRNQNSSERVGFSFLPILMATAPQTGRDFQMRSVPFGQPNQAVGFLEHQLLLNSRNSRGMNTSGDLAF